jgi:hypothetical protein
MILIQHIRHIKLSTEIEIRTARSSTRYPAAICIVQTDDVRVNVKAIMIICGKAVRDACMYGLVKLDSLVIRPFVPLLSPVSFTAYYLFLALLSLFCTECRPVYGRTQHIVSARFVLFPPILFHFRQL